MGLKNKKIIFKNFRTLGDSWLYFEGIYFIFFLLRENNSNSNSIMF